MKRSNEPIAMEDKGTKVLRSPSYNFDFDKRTGFFRRWGSIYKNDPSFSPFGPELCDIEISVNGCPNVCKWCYKGNSNSAPTNMSVQTYRSILDKLPRINGVMVANQVALGLTGIQTNPDLISILETTRDFGLVPNFTISGIDLTPEMARTVVKYVGAIAVSVYPTNKNICYNTVRLLIDLGLKQTNIHLLYHQDNLSFVYEVLRDIQTDNRLSGLNAVILLGLKPKNRASEMHVLGQEGFDGLARFCLDNNIPLGFDSCSAGKFTRFVEAIKMDARKKADIFQMIEPCESFGLFSAYIDVFGSYFPCSFAPGVGEWQRGISVLECDDFLHDIWFSEKVNQQRKASLANERKCILYDLD